jgi:hypothetical protein
MFVLVLKGIRGLAGNYMTNNLGSGKLYILKVLGVYDHGCLKPTGVLNWPV